MPVIVPPELLMAASGLGGPAAVLPADMLEQQPLALQGSGAMAVVAPGGSSSSP